MSDNKYLKWLAENTQSVYWHDSAILSELEDAMANGATGVTTNPFLVNGTLAARPQDWAEQLAGVQKGLKGDEKVEALIGAVTKHIAEIVGKYHGQDFGEGYCCAQVNPNKPGDTQGMIDLAKRYSKIAENIVIKLPATRAGMEAYEECAALGMNVAATVSFTVPQTLATGAAFERGVKRARENGIKPGLGIAVLMVGRLDDYLRDVEQDTHAKATEQDIIQSGTAAIKRAYSIFNERNYDCVLMPAGCRGGYHITDLAGARMIMSIAPKIAELLLNETGPFEERIDIPVDSATIDRLMSMPEFRKAYEPNGMGPDEFITYGSTNRTLTQFCIAGWDPLAAYNY
ncbi:transaldolase family protein [Christensenellaceae bacterium OttesenSCG-928-K19]|nr:transaldolase family protein [Christensenellaceae bacterium OttesenSCG-928-K19]